ncbi:MAG: DNA repair protein RadC [Chloroflexi bacterium]|nr:DNA repair protein RadC [Chloroflexota bacterium]
MDENGYRILIKEMPLDERPRERLQYYGASALTDTELIAIILRTGSNHENALSLAQRLLNAFGGLVGLSRAGIGELCQVPGVGLAKAAQLQAAAELGRRLSLAEGGFRPQIGGPVEAARVFQARLVNDVQEQLMVMLLDTKHHVMRVVTVYTGNVNSAVVRTSEVFREAVRENAPAIILGHNHPSGDLTPSPEDLHVTEEICKAGRLLNIRVLDHLIISRQAYVSLKERWKEFPAF